MRMKKRYVIILIIIFINIILLLLLINYKYKSKEQNNDYYNNSTNVYEIKSYQYQGKIYPENHNEFEKLYKGKIDMDDAYSYIYKFVNNLHLLYEKTNKINNDDEIKEFYNTNKNDLKHKYKISNEIYFKQIIANLKNIYATENYVDNVKLDTNTYKETGKIVECNLIIIFKDGQKLNMKLLVPKVNDVLSIELIPN